MSLIAKQRLLSDIENVMKSTVPQQTMEQIVASVANILSNYECEIVQDSNADSDTQDFIEAFLSTKQVEGRSEQTIALYRSRIEWFFKCVNAPIRSITVFQIRAFLSSEKKRGLSDTTLEHQRSILCGFFGWLHNEGLLPTNPCANLAAIKSAKKVRTPYSDTEITKLLDNCTSARDKAIIEFMRSTGCRVSEICALNRNDVDFVTKECTVFGKGSKERIVFVDDVAVMRLQEYFKERKDDSEALFAGRGSDRLTPCGVRYILKGIAKKANVQNVHPHKFRRTLATGLISHGMPIQDVASILGHDKLDTTMKYVYLNKDDVHNSYRKYA